MNEERIKYWKQKHPEGVFLINAIHPTNKTEHFALIRNPNNTDYILAVGVQEKNGNFSESIFNNCALEFDPLIKQDQALSLGIYESILELVRRERNL